MYRVPTRSMGTRRKKMDLSRDEEAGSAWAGTPKLRLSVAPGAVGGNPRAWDEWDA